MKGYDLISEVRCDEGVCLEPQEESSSFITTASLPFIFIPTNSISVYCALEHNTHLPSPLLSSSLYIPVLLGVISFISQSPCLVATKESHNFLWKMKKGDLAAKYSTGIIISKYLVMIY